MDEAAESLGHADSAPAVDDPFGPGREAASCLGIGENIKHPLGEPTGLGRRPVSGRRREHAAVDRRPTRRKGSNRPALRGCHRHRNSRDAQATRFVQTDAASRYRDVGPREKLRVATAILTARRTAAVATREASGDLNMLRAQASNKNRL